MAGGTLFATSGSVADSSAPLWQLLEKLPVRMSYIIHWLHLCHPRSRRGLLYHSHQPFAAGCSRNER